LPGSATKINAQLGLPGEPNLMSAAAWGGLTPGHAIGQPAPLFPRRDE
jgi:methionyl-tRNA synthetase